MVGDANDVDGAVAAQSSTQPHSFPTIGRVGRRVFLSILAILSVDHQLSTALIPKLLEIEMQNLDSIAPITDLLNSSQLAHTPRTVYIVAKA